jgi:ADP-ribose pyrophosphatase
VPGPANGGPGDEPAPERPAQVKEEYVGPLFSVEVQEWPHPNRRRDVVRHPGAAAILSVTPGGEVILVRQLREAVQERLLEIPAGVFDRRGESAEDLARRELREETGYRATRLEHLGNIYTSPGFTDEAIALYLGEAEPEGQPEQGIEVLTMPLEDAVDAVVGGRIRDAKTMVAVLLARERLGNR